MLLIWDIHLTARIKDRLLSQLKKYVQQHNEEKNLVFLWDFVYHFSYDRNALLELYDLLLERYMQWKNLYILAWNHDWLWNTFVFEEWKKAFHLLSQLNKSNNNEICFITEPLIREIEGKQICFLPSMLEIDESKFPWLSELKDFNYNETIKTRNKNLIFSAQLNLLVDRFLKQYSELILIHHYYVEWVSFPGQKSKFWFKDRALSQKWLDDSNLTMISGHLHQAFAWKNYFCTGSIRASSPLESDQIKCFRQRSENKFIGQESPINYYFTMDRPVWGEWLFDEWARTIVESDIVSHWHEIQRNQNNNFNQNSFPVEFKFSGNLDITQISLSLYVEKLQYDHMAEFIDSNLQQNLQNVQLKTDNKTMENLLENLDKPELAWNQSFENWLELLKNFLQKQYPNDYEEYEKLLQEIKIL